MTQRRLPGDLRREELIARIIRVNHAGEYGAKRIYDGQLAVLRDPKARHSVSHMAAQEQSHLDTFDRLINERQVRPTIFSPLWHVGGFMLGAASALLGEKAAMACTEAVEEVIDEHYAAQEAVLGEDEADLRATIAAFRADEIAHRDEARAHGAENAPGYPVLKEAVKAVTRTAIWLSERA